MNDKESKIGLVLDEHYWRKLETTSLTVAELGSPIVRGALLRDSGTGVVYEVMERGFRPKRGGLEGIMRSELSREASISVKGRTQAPLTGRFLIPIGIDQSLQVLSLQIHQFHQNRITNTGLSNVTDVIVGTPIVVELAGRERSVGIFVPSSGNAGLFGDLWMPATSESFSAGDELALSLASPALSSGPVFHGTIMGVRSNAVALANPVHWPVEV